MGQRERLELTDRDGRPLITEEMYAALSPEEQQSFNKMMRKMSAHVAALLDAADPDTDRYAGLIQRGADASAA